MADTDTTQQVTSQIPVTSVDGKFKNPKRVAAGKAAAEKTRLAREEQKKKLAKADSIMANEQLRKAQEEARKAKEVVEAPPAETTVETQQSQTLTTTQWLSVISIIISVVGIYYKCEELKKALTKIKASALKAPAPKAPAPVEAPKKRGIRSMD